MLNVITDPLGRATGDMLVVLVCRDRLLYGASPISRLIKAARATKDFKGRRTDTITLYRQAGVKCSRVLFVGMGKYRDLSPESFRSAMGRAVTQALGKKLERVVVASPDADRIPLGEDVVIPAMMEGACLANQAVDRYKEKKVPVLKRIGFMAPRGREAAYRRMAGRVRAVSEAVHTAREWVDLPANDKTPARLAQLMVAKAKKAGLKTTVYTEKTLRAKGFGAMMAVGAGSDNPPRLLVIEYAPRTIKKTVALVGKGVTFDSGGLNLKPTGGINDMKIDMAGGAAVAGAMLAIARLKPRRRVVAAIPLVENMVSGNATRPGDIIRTYSGKTVEIGNTDAEGRLILADALAWVIETYQPDTVIDMATLTGACVVALGEKYAAVFTPDDSLSDTLLAASERTHERCWRMPLPDDYRALMKSDLADINNMSSTRWGGAITAALFLSEFVGDARWAHIDIAGPAHSKKGSDYAPGGGTGFGVRLICEALSAL